MTDGSSAARVGLPEREYSKPWCSPTERCANVVESVIGVTTAPVVGSGGWPSWIARVSKSISAMLVDTTARSVLGCRAKTEQTKDAGSADSRRLSARLRTP